MKTMYYIFLSLLILKAKASWDTLYSPSYPYAYLKLSNDEIISIDTTDIDISFNDTLSNIIDPPIISSSSANYSLGLANEDLYAFYGDGTNDTLQIAKLNRTSNSWAVVNYNTTLTKNLQYYEDCAIMTSLDSDDSSTSLYIYGGRFNNSITNRLLEFNPNTNTLNSIITSISPTGFYGASNGIIDTQSSSNVLIGGKASSGWVSMFQIAIWEYKSWTFKTVDQTGLSVNSRINPLVLPVFTVDEDYEEEVSIESVIVLGGELGNKVASPYVLSLSLSGNWEWQNLTNVGDFTFANSIIGALVINNTLLTVTNDGSKKRSETYKVELFDIDGLTTKKSLIYSSSSKVELKSTSSTSSSQSSASSSSSIPSQSSSITQSLGVASSVTTPSATESLSSTLPNTQKSHSKTTTIVIASVIPIIGIIIIAIVVYILVKKFKRSSILLDQSDSESSNSNPNDYYNMINEIDNQSISSWNAKRNEFEFNKNLMGQPKRSHSSQLRSKQTPTREKSIENIHDFTNHTQHNRNGSTPLQVLKKIYRSSTDLHATVHHTNLATTTKRSSGPFADPEDLPDKQELSSPITFHNQASRTSVISNSTSSTADQQHVSQSEEESKIDEFFQSRDVQVLVSSKRRSKLRITNPDLEETIHDQESLMSEVETGTNISSRLDLENDSPLSNTDSSLFNEKLDFEYGDDHTYFSEVLKAFDDDIESDVTSSGHSK